MSMMKVSDTSFKSLIQKILEGYAESRELVLEEARSNNYVDGEPYGWTLRKSDPLLKNVFISVWAEKAPKGEETLCLHAQDERSLILFGEENADHKKVRFMELIKKVFSFRSTFFEIRLLYAIKVECDLSKALNLAHDWCWE